MIILALDTSLASCSVCVYDAGQDVVLAEAQEIMERGQAEALPPMVARIMGQAGVGFAKLGRIAVTTGPGTFTGIRIGLSFARGLGLTRGLKVIGIDTMKAVEVSVPEAYSTVNVIHQAGASGLFYFWQKNISRNIELLNPEGILARLPSTQTLLVGTGAQKLRELSGRGDLVLRPDLDLPLAACFVRYAASLPPPDHFPEPTYLREADAKPQALALRPLAGLALRAAGPEQDLPILAKLHQASFDHGWTEVDFAKMLASPGYGAVIAQTRDGPVGFLLYRAAADEAEVITFAVDPALRRRGAGRALMIQTIAQLKSLNINRFFLDVAASNTEAVALYKAAGFAEAGRRKAYYAKSSAPPEDALMMALKLA
jgi:tRNA threonylcarbamoyladenosine biosynthesis protein TsaB